MATVQETDQRVDAFVGSLKPELRGLFADLRKLVRETVPEARETVKWGYPCYEQNGNVCSLMPAEGYVRLQFFRGAELQDPQALLEGTGKGMRHVKVRHAVTLRQALRALIAEAANLNAKGGRAHAG
jgi:hypothetical protein